MKKKLFLVILISVIAVVLFAFPVSVYADPVWSTFVYDHSNTHYYYSIISSPFNEPITIPIVYSTYDEALNAAKNMANAAMQRADVQAKIAALSNEEFITYLYDALFHRTPDDAGYAGWLNALDDGLSRSDMISSFINSSEFEMRYVYTVAYGEDVFRVVADDR